MERFGFGPEAAFVPAQELLVDVTVAPLTSSIYHGAPAQAAIFRIAPGGRIALHPAACPQVLAVLEGSGEVNGEPIAAGEAVFWAEGEEHETTSAHGLTALIVEGNGLSPPRRSETSRSEAPGRT